jgi:CDP-2,3-bis-(O-geranylgeranyl)-sn-glycerol synthase
MSTILHDALLVLWFFLPAAAANGVPVLAALVPGLKHFSAPLDAGRTFRGKRIFGKNKSWRGLIAGMISATIVLGLQQLVTMHSSALLHLTDEINYVHLPTLLLGPALGAGALLGDAVESFFKRQLDIEPGTSWFPFDQTDFIIGAIIASLPFVVFSLSQYVWTFAILIILHITVDNIGHIFKLKERIG